MRSVIQEKVIRVDHQTYFSRYMALPFEPIVEHFRRKRCVELMLRFAGQRFPYVLEIGIGRNPMLDLLPCESGVGIDPVEELLGLARERANNCDRKFLNTTLNEFSQQTEWQGKFDLVIASSVLHVVADSNAALQEIGVLAGKDALLVVVVPNTHSLHRAIGVAIGKTASLGAKSTTAAHLGQQASWSAEDLEGLLHSHGWRLVHLESFFLKPLHHHGMETMTTGQLISERDIEELGGWHSESSMIGAELICIAERIPE